MTRVTLLNSELNSLIEAAAIVSLVMNALATILIAFKAWCVHRCLRLVGVLIVGWRPLDQETQTDGQGTLRFCRNQVAGLERPRDARGVRKHLLCPLG